MALVVGFAIGRPIWVWIARDVLFGQGRFGGRIREATTWKSMAVPSAGMPQPGARACQTPSPD